MAPRAQLEPAGACGRLHADSGRRRRGIRGCHRVTRHAASTPAAVCVGDLVESGRLPPTPTAAQAATHEGAGRPRTRPRLIDGSRAVAVSAVARGLPAAAWRSISWRNGRQPRRRAQVCGDRVTPANAWRQGHSRPKSGYCARKKPDEPSASSTTSCICRRRRRCVRSWPSRTSAGR